MCTMCRTTITKDGAHAGVVTPADRTACDPHHGIGGGPWRVFGKPTRQPMDPRIVLDNLDVGVMAISPDWTIAEWSAPAARITGLPAERVVGRNFWVAFPSTKATPVERVLRDVLADGEPRMLVTPARAPELKGMVFETRVTGRRGITCSCCSGRCAKSSTPSLPRPRFSRRSSESAGST